VKIAEERAAETRRVFEADAEKLLRCALCAAAWRAIAVA